MSKVFSVRGSFGHACLIIVSVVKVKIVIISIVVVVDIVVTIIDIIINISFCYIYTYSYCGKENRLTRLQKCSQREREGEEREEGERERERLIDGLAEFYYANVRRAICEGDRETDRQRGKRHAEGAGGRKRKDCHSKRLPCRFILTV